jgi:hypothetical protein
MLGSLAMTVIVGTLPAGASPPCAAPAATLEAVVAVHHADGRTPGVSGTLFRLSGAPGGDPVIMMVLLSPLVVLALLFSMERIERWTIGPDDD